MRLAKEVRGGKDSKKKRGVEAEAALRTP